MDEKKKILIVCKFFYPDNNPRSFRATELAKEFALQHHIVTVLTLKKPVVHCAFEIEHKLTIIDLGKNRLKLFDFGKSKIANLFSRAMNRLLQLAFDYPDIELMFKVKKALRFECGYDMLISIAIPHTVHWGVAWAKSEKHPIANTWVADCGDPYMGETTDTFRRWFYFKYVEKWFMKKTDFITIPIEAGTKGYYPEFHSKIRVIPQGFKIGLFHKIVIHQRNPVPTFAFAGNFSYGNRDPRPFLEYLATLEIDFKFTIYSGRGEIVEPYLKRLNGKLIVSDIIPRDELLPKLSLMDFLVNFDNYTTTQLPSKLIDYAICKRPVLNIPRELDKTIIREFLVGDYTHSMTMGNIDSFRIENVCAAFLKLDNENKDEKYVFSSKV